MAYFNIIVSVVIAALTYPLWHALYNAYLHPLAKVPGPRTWAASPIPFIYCLIKGTIIQDAEKLHRKYGPIVRISPNEVTFAAPEAWTDIFGRGFAKDQLWWRKQPGKPDSLISVANEKDHQRMRKVLAPGFTPRALKAQEPFVQRYIGLLVDRLRGQAAEHPNGFDIVPWMNYTTFDIFGDLGFGESFDCLQNSRYHPWIALLFNSVKAASFIIAARFYPLIDTLLMKAIPKSLKEMQDRHFQQIVDKVDRRLNWEVERPDLMSHVISQGHDDQSKGMSRAETNVTFMILTTAGSETTATCLSGTLNHLISNKEQRHTLVKEIRAASLDGTFTLAALDELPYLNAVIQEGLRLCPPIPYMLPRVVPEGGAEVCGTWLPGGTSVSLQQWTLNRDPHCFHRASEFLPERWLPEATEDSSPFSKDSRHALHPFNTGPHSCLGRNLAMAEMRLVLARVLWHFDIAPAGDTMRWEDLRTFLLVEKKPVMLKVTPHIR